jgi:hypothetical protein
MHTTQNILAAVQGGAVIAILVTVLFNWSHIRKELV